ncbi:MAG: flippase [Verrucomicrobiae bacterium]|nr:flippase [Verrucomicrobiae bacterium]MCP5541784.1 flippase [Akkermansiaceae bacterium]
MIAENTNVTRDAIVPGLWGRLAERFPMLPRIAGSLGWNLADRAVAIVNGLLVGAWVARYMGPERYGLFISAVTLAGFFGSIACLGMNRVFDRDLADRPEESPRLLGTASALLFAAGAATLLLAGLTIWALPLDRVSVAVTLIVSSTFLAGPAWALRSWFQGRLDARSLFFANGLGLGLSAGLKIAMILAGAPLWAFAVAVSLETFVAAALLWLRYRRTCPASERQPWRVDRELLREYLRQAGPLTLALVATTIYHRMDTLMLKAMAGDEPAGIYAAAARISESFYFLPAALAAAFLPSLLSARKTNRALYRRRMEAFVKLHAAIGYGLAIGGTLLAGWGVRLLFGEAFAAAVPVLTIHVWAALPFFLANARHEYLLAEGVLRLNLPSALIGAVSNLALNFLLIPRLGAAGAAWATLIAYSLAWVLSSFVFRAARPAGWMQLRALLWPVPDPRSLARGVS